LDVVVVVAGVSNCKWLTTIFILVWLLKHCAHVKSKHLISELQCKVKNIPTNQYP
jgi:hypothetical protein